MKDSTIDFSGTAVNLDISIVELAKEQDFNLLLVFEKNFSNTKSLKFLSILYKDQFYTKTYAEARYYIESMKIFADQKYADLDTDDFEIREKKDEKGRTNHSFLCKFIKNENVYLSRAQAKTIATVFLESTFLYNKQSVFEKKLIDFPISMTRYGISENTKKILDSKIEKLQEEGFSKELKKHIFSTIKDLYLKNK